MPYLASMTPTDKSFAAYYNEVSYGKYQVTGTVIGPYPFSMTTCDTTGMYKAIEPMITGTYNHLIYYFKQSNLCDFGGLGEEGSALKPAKRTWMNGSLSCVVLMQEPGHNLGLMHANTMKCGTSSFTTNPASCTITEYGSSMSTMGGGCKQFNAYERWYMNWLSGCNGVKTPANGTFNLLPLETNCSSGTGIQVLQVPFPATLTVSDPQSTSTAVNLNNYYVELRIAGGTLRRLRDAHPDLGRRLHRPDGLHLRERQRAGPDDQLARNRQPAEQRLDRAAQHEPLRERVRRAHHGRTELRRPGGRPDDHAHLDQRDGRHRDGQLPERRNRLAHLHRRHGADGARAHELYGVDDRHRWHDRRRRRDRHRRDHRHRRHAPALPARKAPAGRPPPAPRARKAPAERTGAAGAKGTGGTTTTGTGGTTTGSAGASGKGGSTGRAAPRR